MTRVRALSLLSLSCILILTVCSKTEKLPQHSTSSDTVQTTTSSSFSASLSPYFESQTQVLPKSNIEVILAPTSLSYDLVTQTIQTSKRSSSQKLRDRKQKRKERKKKTNGKKDRKKGRKYRSFLRVPLGQQEHSCPTRTIYMFKTTAVDIFGDTVDVYPAINIGNLALDQYFYESFCDAQQCSCGGIDNKKFKSSCQTTYGYAYAKVVKSGEVGWSYIKVRTGCSCVIQEKRQDPKSVHSFTAPI